MLVVLIPLVLSEYLSQSNEKKRNKKQTENIILTVTYRSSEKYEQKRQELILFVKCKFQRNGYSTD